MTLVEEHDLWHLGYTRQLAESARLNQPNDCISADVTCTGLVGGGAYVYTRSATRGTTYPSNPDQLL